ncbi:MAG TPA: glucose-6-phosphate dehydrogenase [Planctomycetota bacterium]|nr:glucose-6-phosphate dehydrogenase [Planctomycetota bacterium]
MDRIPDPCIMVLFGATGDLARRKLIPALYNLSHDGLLPKNFAVCAYARKPKSDADFRAELRAELEKYSRQKPRADWETLAQSIYYVQGEFNDDAGFARLGARLDEIDTQCGTKGNRLYYLAVDSEFFVPIVERLSKNKLLVFQRPDQPWRRVVLEKPIGHDLPSAQQMLHDVSQHISERQIYRIDHYLGKETVQNILALRFGNCIYEPLWNRKYVDHVQITVAEAEGVGSRAGYYDNSGALRDMVQNHMLQLLCLVAMEAPGTMGADDIRNEKVKVLKNLRKMKSPAGVAEHTLRGQYGPSPDGKLPAYRAEPGVPAASNTETYVALRCFVDTWRWADVPFLLRAGKRMPRRETEISIHFRVPPLNLFGDMGDEKPCFGNILTLNIQPHEGVVLDMAAKVPGAGMKLTTVEMDFGYTESFNKQVADAYERLLLDAMSGDQTLFTRADEVEAQWEFVNCILEGWKKLPPPRFPNYFAGTWGPDEAVRLVPPCAGAWHMESKRTVVAAHSRTVQ